MIKVSKYNIIKKISDKTILFNMLSSGMLELDDKYSNKLTEVFNGMDSDKELVENLKLGNFIINDDFDEIELLKYFSNISRFNEKHLGLTIAPTLECNFACPYCYESGYRYNTMSNEIKNNVIEFVDKKTNNVDNFSVTWYGGEPLMQVDIIEELTYKFKELCDEKKIKYNAHIISNGYLLTKDVAERLKGLDINDVQITLDGPKEIHDERRYLTNKQGTYDTIIENIKNVCDIINVGIRINVDINNIDYAEEILKEIYDLGLSKKVFVYVAMVDDINNPSLRSQCIKSSDFSEYEIYFHKKALQYGFDTINLPKLHPAICGAVGKNSYVIDPLGDLYKCWNTIGNKDEKIGNIKSGELISNNTFKWMNYNPFENECVDCNILPLCLGGCPYYKVKANSKKCTTLIDNLDNIVELYYDRRVKSAKV